MRFQYEVFVVSFVASLPKYLAWGGSTDIGHCLYEDKGRLLVQGKLVLEILEMRGSPDSCSYARQSGRWFPLPLVISSLVRGRASTVRHSGQIIK